MNSGKCIPAITIAALKGGGGKTIAALGITRALTKRGLKVACFKKGPDYIDAAWLGKAARADCYNLDPYLMSEHIIYQSFSIRSQRADIAVIEGNRGLFDGLDVQGTCSTSMLSRLLGARTILVVDCTKVTRTIAALVSGCLGFEHGLDIMGVILNQVAGNRHRRIVSESIEKYTSLPVLGAIPRMKKDPLPMRHLGVTPAYEYHGVEASLDELAGIAEKHLYLDLICELAQRKPARIDSSCSLDGLYRMAKGTFSGIRIGIIRDRAFQFYYPENIEVFEFAGAEVVFIDSLSQKTFPDVHALYIGGGFPETQAEMLQANRTFREVLSQFIKKGLPVYAECGGLMYLGKRVRWNDSDYEMVGAFPMDFIMKRRPVGHGYTKLFFDRDCPFFSKGTKLLGHEFHYSQPCFSSAADSEELLCCSVQRGHGFGNGREGICVHNCFGTYSHCHVLGEPGWAIGLLEAAKKFKLNSAC